MSEKQQARPLTPPRHHRSAATRQAIVEACEPRRLYDATPSYSVTGTPGNDTIAINVTKNANGKYDVATSLNGKGKSYTDVQPGYLNVYALDGDDKITITGQFDQMPKQTVYGNGGKDTLTLKAVGTRSLDERLPNGVWFQGGSEVDKLILDSSQQPVQKDLVTFYTINERKISVVELDDHPKMPAVFTSDGVEKQEVLTGGHINHVNVPRNTLDTEVHGNLGYDTVVVGDGYTDAVQGQLYVDGGGGIFDRITFDESDRVSNMPYTLDAYQFDTPNIPPVVFTNMDNVELNAGSGANTVYLNSVAQNTRVDLNGNGGDDLFFLGNGDYDAVAASQVVVNGGTGKNHVLVRDGDDVQEHNYGLFDSKIVRGGSGEIHLSDIYSVDLRTGHNKNYVSAMMSSNTSFDVRDSGLPDTANADTLYVIDGSGKPPVPSMTRIGEGVYTDPKKRNVAFGGFERFSGDDQVGGAISGRVYDDKDGNGKWDVEDEGLGPVSVYVDANQNSKYDAGERQVITDATGRFQIAGLAAGTYYLGQRQPYGWRQTTPANGDPLKVVVNAHTVTADRYLGVTQSATVSGRVFVDKDKDGKLDGNELGDSGWRVYDDADNDGQFDASEASVLTRTNGEYEFDGLAAGVTHRLRVTPVAGHTPFYNGGQLVHTPAGSVRTNFNFSLLKSS